MSTEWSAYPGLALRASYSAHTGSSLAYHMQNVPALAFSLCEVCSVWGWPGAHAAFSAQSWSGECNACGIHAGSALPWLLDLVHTASLCIWRTWPDQPGSKMESCFGVGNSYGSHMPWTDPLCCVQPAPDRPHVPCAAYINPSPVWHMRPVMSVHCMWYPCQEQPWIWHVPLVCGSDLDTGLV